MKIAVVLTFESLPLRFLGCYGCLEHNTPCWNRLASESVLFDRHFAENLDPAAKNHAWWTGRSQSFRTHAEQRRDGNVLTQALRYGGVASHLFVETAVTTSSEIPAGFDTLTVSS
ncbi:MAG: hypothetical protein IID45_10355, partial [Planctomycetes bacterium]|nr:hypothetical protein [Planctomycetota bacterium]